MRFLCIDSHAILHRAYHALPPLTTPEGKPVQAAYGYTSMLLRLIHELSPTHIAAAFDRPKPTFRKKLYKEYQAHRPPMADDLPGQIDIAHVILQTMTIPIFEVDGYEADDVIGTIAENVKSKPCEIVIVTGDKDLLQLVDNRVKIYMPVNGLSEGKLYGIKEVEERLGIPPSQVVDYKAIVGDPSDNYPGVAGIGPKTAMGLLKQFTNLDAMYQHLDEIKSDRIRTLLREKKDDAFLSHTLATVIRNVPLDFTANACAIPPIDTPAIRELFLSLGFKSLLNRLNTQRQIPSDGKKEKTEGKKKEEKKIAAEQATLF